jgi:hypothetical protein
MLNKYFIITLFMINTILFISLRRDESNSLTNLPRFLLIASLFASLYSAIFRSVSSTSSLLVRLKTRKYLKNLRNSSNRNQKKWVPYSPNFNTKIPTVILIYPLNDVRFWLYRIASYSSSPYAITHLSVLQDFERFKLGENKYFLTVSLNHFQIIIIIIEWIKILFFPIETRKQFVFTNYLRISLPLTL